MLNAYLSTHWAEMMASAAGIPKILDALEYQVEWVVLVHAEDETQCNMPLKRGPQVITDLLLLLTGKFHQ